MQSIKITESMQGVGTCVSQCSHEIEVGNKAGKAITQARELNTSLSESNHNGKLQPEGGSRPRRWVPTQEHRTSKNGACHLEAQGPFPDVEVSIFEDIATAVSGSRKALGRHDWPGHRRGRLQTRRTTPAQGGSRPRKVGPDPEGGSPIGDRSRASRFQFSRTSPPPFLDLVSPRPPRLAGHRRCGEQTRRTASAQGGSRPGRWVPTQKQGKQKIGACRR